jgi:ATP-dependent DNA helicase RecG
MLSKEELKGLISEVESDRVERTISTNNTDKFAKAICAFSNDLPDNRKPGYLIIGVNDDGTLAGLKVSDQLLQNLSAIRSDGNILPQPKINVSREIFPGGEVAVVEVFPSPLPPVRYKGKIWIRVGPRRGIANEAEERALIEKRITMAKTFDAQPCFEANEDELSIDLFKLNYLPAAIEGDILAENNRSILQQLASLRFYDLSHNCPTNAGILLFGINPLFYLPGAYIQYVKFSGVDMAADIQSEKRFSGDLVDVLRRLEDFVKDIINEKPVLVNNLKERIVRDYPVWALRELLMNAVMHRNYESNDPIHFYQFSDRIEIINSGGLYGDVRPENFPNASDYRNPILAEAMKVLGYVNKFNRGIIKAQAELEVNGNPPAEFEIDKQTKFGVKIYKREDI